MYIPEKNNLAKYVAPVIFGLFFVLFPWENVFGVSFFDIPIYLIRIDGLVRGAEAQLSLTFAQWVSSEPIWGWILLAIGTSFNEPINGLIIISFFCIIVFSTLTFSRSSKLIGLILLLNPMVIDLIMSQVRSALSMSLLLIAFTLRKRYVAITLMVIAVLIHTIGFVLIMIYVFSHLALLFERKFSHRIAGLFSLLFSAAIALALSVGRAWILDGSGDRRIEYAADTNSIAYLGYWFVLGLAIILLKRNKNVENPWTDYFSIVVLTTPLLMTLFATNGVRFVALGFPLILHAIFNRSGRTRNLLIASLFAYQLILYFYWFKFSH